MFYNTQDQLTFEGFKAIYAYFSSNNCYLISELDLEFFNEPMTYICRYAGGVFYAPVKDVYSLLGTV